MVTTHRQIIEKMLGRRLNDKEFRKVCRVSHNESLKWAKEQACKEGRQPGYNKKCSEKIIY